jgi:predicted amidophosphoribosyltransferase
MALTLCPNCRLPVNRSSQKCPLCAAPISTSTTAPCVPIAAAIAAVVATTFAVFARRRA